MIDVNLKKYKKIIHLSHNDLDGYGSQVLTKDAFSDKIEFINTSYIDIKTDLFNAFKILYKINVKTLVLITDINLSSSLCAAIDKVLKREPFKNIEVCCLDHHISGINEAKTYSWYYLDSTICATKITYDFILHNTDHVFFKLGGFHNYVNAYDLRLEDESNFKLGSLLNELVFEGPKFPDELKKERGLYIRYILKRVASVLSNADDCSEIEEFYIPSGKRLFLKESVGDKIAYDKTITLKAKFNCFIYESLKKKKHDIFSFGEYRFKIFWDMDGGVFQDIASFFLKNEDKEFNAIMNIKKDGSISTRTIEKFNIDVSEFCKKYTIDGGGHTLSAGGKLKEKKETSLSYKESLNILKKLTRNKN